VLRFDRGVVVSQAAEELVAGRTQAGADRGFEDAGVAEGNIAMFRRIADAL
jgi:hypothetical protein